MRETEAAQGQAGNVTTYLPEPHPLRTIPQFLALAYPSSWCPTTLMLLFIQQAHFDRIKCA